MAASTKLRLNFLARYLDIAILPVSDVPHDRIIRHSQIAPIIIIYLLLSRAKWYKHTHFQENKCACIKNSANRATVKLLTKYNSNKLLMQRKQNLLWRQIPNDIWYTSDCVKKNDGSGTKKDIFHEDQLSPSMRLAEVVSLSEMTSLQWHFKCGGSRSHNTNTVVAAYCLFWDSFRKNLRNFSAAFQSW